MYEYAAGLVSIHDGDTMRFDVDLGFEIHFILMDVRLYGINAPELNTDAGKTALAYVQQWFAQHGHNITLNTYKDKTEKYGRYLAKVVAADGAVLNDDLVSSGNAVVYLP